MAAVMNAPAAPSPVPEHMFDARHYAKVRLPLAEAETLPRWCYTSQRFYAREVERMFLRRWLFVGREDEVPDAGGYLAADTPAGPVLLLRGDDGVLRAFANSCRHRGARLLEGIGNCKAVVCPYHSWVYALDGSLRRAQGMDGIVGFDPSEYGLRAMRLDTWGGFVFVSFLPDIAPLAVHLGDFPQKFAGHHAERMRCVRRVSFDIAGNWKLVLENAVETYHTGTVHRDTLGRQTGHREPTRGDWAALWVEGDESIAVLPGEPPGFAPIPGLAGRAALGTFFTIVFPNMQFALAQDCIWWLHVTPSAPDRCTLSVGSCFPESTIGRDDFESRVQAYYRRWDAATPEDARVAEIQQAGLSSPLYRPGRFSLQEFGVHQMANWVLDQVLEAT